MVLPRRYDLRPARPAGCQVPPATAARPGLKRLGPPRRLRLQSCYSTFISFPMNTLNTMRDLLIHDVQMMYSAETMGVEALEQIVKVAHDPQLRVALKQHSLETKRQIARLEQIMTMLDAKPGREVCSAMKGMLTDAQKLMRKESAPEVLDAMLIGAAQKMEHFEIACYGTAVRMTEDLGMTQACELLRQTLEEEKKTDGLLTELATQRVNSKAEATMM